MKAKPILALIGTGGSISTPGRSALDLFEYAEFGRTLGVAELLEVFAPYLTEFDVVPIAFDSVVSTAIGPSDWLRLNDLIHAVVREHSRLDGIVVTHGTATLEETAYFLNLTIKVRLPVVVVGAQRPPNGLSSDSGLNLLNACRAASAPQCTGLGVLVVLNDEIHAARDVTKTSNFRVNTFKTRDFGCLGYVDPDGKVAIYRQPVRMHTYQSEFDVRGTRTLPRVDVVYSYAGADGCAVSAFVRAGAQCLISAGLAPGKTTPAERDEFQRAVTQGVVVVQSSRAGSGRIGRRQRMLEVGVLDADNLNPQKARVLAMLARAHTSDQARIQEYFYRY